MTQPALDKGVAACGEREERGRRGVGVVDYEMVVTNVRSLITHLLDAFFGFYYDG